MTAFRSTEPAADHAGPQGYEDDPSTPWGWDVDFVVGGSNSIEEPGHASPHRLEYGFNGGTDDFGFASTSGANWGDVSELWWRFYLDTSVTSGMAVDDANIIAWIPNAAETAGLYVYITYDELGALSAVAFYDVATFTHLAFTNTVPDGTGMLCYEGHYLKSATVGVLEGWVDGVAFDTNVTGADTSASLDAGDEIYLGVVSAFTGTPSASDWLATDHFAMSATGRLLSYEERDAKRVSLANIGNGHAPVAVAGLGGVLTQ